MSKGRALTLYEKVHTENVLGNKRVQNRFLSKLKQLLPEGCHVTILTDAGFHGPWFKQVVDLGWDYIGRVRGTYEYSLDEGKSWRKCRNLLKKPTHIAKSYGKVQFGKGNPMTAYLYSIKERIKRRKAYTPKGKKRADSHSKE